MPSHSTCAFGAIPRGARPEVRSAAETGAQVGIHVRAFPRDGRTSRSRRRGRQRRQRRENSSGEVMELSRADLEAIVQAMVEQAMDTRKHAGGTRPQHRLGSMPRSHPAGDCHRHSHYLPGPVSTLVRLHSRYRPGPVSPRVHRHSHYRPAPVSSLVRRHSRYRPGPVSLWVHPYLRYWPGPARSPRVRQ